MRASDETIAQLKSHWRETARVVSDQKRGIPAPPTEKDPSGSGGPGIPLTPPERLEVPDIPVWEAIRSRRSRRRFSNDPIELDRLATVLYATQGVRKDAGKALFRTVPSGGARQPFESYVFARRVAGLSAGLYWYRSTEHALYPVAAASSGDDERFDAAVNGQLWNAAAYLVLTALPYRSEWRYPGRAGKLIGLDAGHVMQNAYLICESLGLGTCAIGAYDQQLLDAFLGVDGVEELAVYAAPIGSLP